MVTLDGLVYTFNGAGEFTILDGLNGSLLIQGRAEPAVRVDGGIPVGTAGSALPWISRACCACRWWDTSGDSFHVYCCEEKEHRHS